MFGVISFLSVIIAAIAKIAIGMFWYSPRAFGQKWQQLSKIVPNKDKMPIAFVGMTLNAVITAAVLANLIARTHSSDIASGFIIGLMCWVGFSMPISVCGFLWEDKPLELVFIQTGHELVSLVVMGVIIGLL